MSREISKQTWQKIDAVVGNIRRNALEITNQELKNRIYADADLCHLLLKNLAAEIWVEDKAEERKAE
jgi:hypothetical protein